MKTKTVANYNKCTNKSCGKIIMPFEVVGIVGRDMFSRDKVVCMACKRGNK